MPRNRVPSGYANGGQFTGRTNAPRRAKTGPLTKGYDNLRNLEQMPEMRPVDKNKNAVKLAEARNTPRMRKLGAKLANAFAELQIARRSGDKKRIAAWERETSKREEAYLEAYREEAKARGARPPKTRKERTAEAAEVEARAQARRDKEGRRIEARREAAVSRSVFPKLVEAQRAQQAQARGEAGRTTVNRRFAEHEEAFQASVARRMGEEKPKRARKAARPKAPAEPKAKEPRKPKKGGYAEWAAERDRLRLSFKGGGHPDDTEVMAQIIGHQGAHPRYAARYMREHPELYGYREPERKPRAPRTRKAETTVPRQGRRVRRNTQERAAVYSEARRGLRNRRARGA